MQNTAREKLMLAGLALAGLTMNILVALANRVAWAIDFNQYYTAGRLVGTGRLYDWNAVRSLELEHTARVVTFTRIPAFALAFKPLSALPWPLARALWLAIGLAALAGFLALWPGLNRARAFTALCWSMPAALCLATGQDSVLFLFFIALGLSLLSTGRDFAAGLAFSACIAKPHLALLVPVLVIALKKWKALLGGAAGVATAIALCFLSGEGTDWPRRLVALTSRIDGHPLVQGLSAANFPPVEAPERMPNLRGLLSFLGGGIALEAAVALLVIAAVWMISRSKPIPFAGAIVLAGGLLLSHHAYTYDACLLIPAMLLPLEMPAPEWMRIGALFALTPAPYLFMLSNASIAWLIVGHVALTGCVLALIGLGAWRTRSGTQAEGSVAHA